MLKLQIIGNLGQNAALKETASGRFVSFNVAHTDKRTDTAIGEMIERTTWVSCTINGDGGRLFPYLTKGTKVYILGDLSMREYTGQDGLKHTGLNCFVREIELCGGKSEPQEDKRTF